MNKILATLLLTIGLTAPVLGQTYLNLSGASWHSEPGHNALNLGAGVEVQVAPRWNVQVGSYRNSEWRWSTYALGRYSLTKSGDLDVGASVGVVSNYDRYAVMPIVTPDVCYKYVCVLVLPKLESSGSWIVGVHLRIPLE